jgi:mannose-6-phosphate isomerase-like protein (cupin superfamily)
MYVCSADEGPRFLVLGGTETRLAVPAAASGGAYCILDQVIPAGHVTPIHRHEKEDQTAFVLEGTLGFWVEGGEEVEVGAGGSVSRPRGRFHASWNPTESPTRILEITSPGERFERWVWDVHEATQRDGVSLATIAEVGGRYGITYVEALEGGPMRAGDWFRSER